MLLETGVRGGAVALLVLLVIGRLPGGLWTPVGRATLLFDLCAMAFLVETAPGVQDSLAWWVVPLRFLSNAAAGVFVVWAEAAFNDAPWPAPWRWSPAGVMLLLAGIAMATGSGLAWQVTHVVALVLAAAGVVRVLAGRATDLMERRRRARLLFACGLGLGVGAITALDWAGARMLPALAAVLGLALAAGLMRLNAIAPDEARAARPLPDAVPDAPPVAEMTADEHRLAGRLRDIMVTERAYREAGLTVRGLAERLGVPEYRLRQLINRGLGHRNFTDFVNAHRLAEARAALADPAQARVPVLTIALDAGWGSIGPFNRAFKADTGQTPTEFRRHAYSGVGLADSENGQVLPDPARPGARSGKTLPEDAGRPRA